MTGAARARVAALRRYPVKGLGGEALAEIALSPGRPLAGDRRFALAPANEAANGWRPKRHFATLMDEPALAGFAATSDGAALALARDGRDFAAARADDEAGRARLAALLSEALGRPLALVDAGDDPALTDAREPFVSIVNAASVAALAAEAGLALDPRRFRANVVVEGWPAWAEMAWAGRTLALGRARLRIVEPIERCAATHVNPETARRDANLVRALDRGFGHACMGVYATVTAGGPVRLGDDAALA